MLFRSVSQSRYSLMCLTLKRDAQLQTAAEDIVVYKVVCPRNHMEGWAQKRHDAPYFSPYRNFPYHLGKEYASKLDRYESSILTTVAAGLHTYVRLEDAFYSKYTYEVIIRGRIPAGATYYAGSFGKDASYASDKLILDEEVVFGMVDV